MRGAVTPWATDVLATTQRGMLQAWPPYRVGATLFVPRAPEQLLLRLAGALPAWQVHRGPNGTRLSFKGGGAADAG
jgi:hypothetical protein